MEEHCTLMGVVVEKVQSAKSGLNEAFTSLLTGIEVCDVILLAAFHMKKYACVPPPIPSPHSYTEPVKTREAPHPPPFATQSEPLPRRHRPPRELDVPHPPYRMSIYRRSHCPADSATPSSTSKELPQRSPHLSCHLHS